MNDVAPGNARGSGYERAADNWYVEPASAVRALLRAERFYGAIIDPACGGGTIPRVCIEAGLGCVGGDLVDRGYPGVMIGDFLSADITGYDHAICNPPYDLAEEFAMKMASEVKHKAAVLVRLAWMEGEGRFKRLFATLPPARVLVFRNRISCPPGGTDIPAKGGAVAYAWVVWDKDHRGPTQLDWVRAE